MSACALGGMERDMSTAAECRPALVSSPGKVIIHGEHAVVYGKPAIATSVNLRCYLLLVPSGSGHVTLDLPSLHLSKSWPVTEINELLGCAEDEHLDALRKYCGNAESSSISTLASLVVLYLLTHIMTRQLRSLQGMEITVSSELPFGAGLGSSAAYSVCVAAGLLSSIGAVGRSGEQAEGDLPCIPDSLLVKATDCGVEIGVAHHHLSDGDLQLINHWGFEAEKLVHGTPSGIDNSISVYGGAIRFQAGKFTQLERMPNLSILLVHTKVPRSTKKLVSAVRQRYETYPEVVCPILNSIEELVKRAEGLLHEIHAAGEWPSCSQHYSQLQELLGVNHQLLNALGAGHPALDRVCHITGDAGGLGAKLTGAGGGGCAIVLYTPETSQEKLTKVKAQLQDCGYDCWQTSIGSKGVILQSSSS